MKNRRQISKTLKQGAKVRVYDLHGRIFGHGDVIGISEAGKLILERRPEYKNLSIHDIDATRLNSEVQFLTRE